MLEQLGISAEAEAIYWAMLENPDWGVAELAGALSVGETTVRDTLSLLAEQALVRPSWEETGELCAVSPQVGLLALVDRVEKQMRRQHESLDATRAMVIAAAAGHDRGRKRDEVVRLEGLDAVRERLSELARATERECLTFTTGSALPATAIESGKALNRLALDRGVSIRNVYQHSVLNDRATMEYARWMAARGGRSRVVPLVPMRLTIVDRTTALVPIDPHASSLGAIEVRGGSLLVALCSLFDMVWEHGVAFGEPPSVDVHGLTDLEEAVLDLLAAGLTDDAAGRRLGLSERTVRRTVSDLMRRLGAASRFEAGVKAAQRGWVGQ